MTALPKINRISIEPQTSTNRVAEPGKLNVYLVGPITGLVVRDQDWRSIFHRELGQMANIVDPAQRSVVRARISEFPASMRSKELEAFGRNTIRFNRAAIQHADVLVANLLGAKQVSIGSVGALFWADAFGVPILLALDRDSNPHNHLMLDTLASERHDDLGSLLKSAKKKLAAISRQRRRAHE